MCANAIADEMHTVGWYTARMLCNVLDQLGNAEGAEAWSPFHLTQTWFLDSTTIVDYDDVVVATLEIRIANIRTGRIIATSAKAMDYDFRRMRTIEVCVVQCFWVEDVQSFRCFLRTSCIQIEFDLRMWATERFVEA